MKKSGTVVVVPSSLSDPALIAFRSGLPLDLWCPRVAGCFGIFDLRFPDRAAVVLVLVVEVLTEEVRSDREPVGREAVVEVEVVLDVVRVVDPGVVDDVVVVGPTGGTVIVVVVVGVTTVVVLELVVLDVEVEVVLELVLEVVVVVLAAQLSDSVFCERSSVVTFGSVE